MHYSQPPLHIRRTTVMLRRWSALLVLLAILGACGAPQRAPTPPTSEPAPPQNTLTALTPAPSTEPPAATPQPSVVPSAPALPPPSPTPPFPSARIDAATLPQIQLLRSEGFGSAQAAALSADNRLLAVATSAGVALFEAETLAHLRFIPLGQRVWDVAFSADGQILQIALDQPAAPASTRQFSVDTGALEPLSGDLLPALLVDKSAPFVLSPNGRRRADLLPRDSVPTPGVAIGSNGDGPVVYNDATTVAISFSPDSSIALLVGYDETVRLLDLDNGAIRSLELPAYSAAAFSPDALSLLASGRSLRRLDTVTGALIGAPQSIAAAQSPNLLGWEQSIGFSSDGSTVMVAGAYNAFETSMREAQSWRFAPQSLESIWQVSAGSIGIMNLRTSVGALSPASPLSARSDDGYILTISGDNAPARVVPMTAQIGALAFSPDGALVAVGDEAGSLHLLRSADGGLSRSFSFESAITQLVFSPDGTLLAALLSSGDLLVQPLDRVEGALRIAGFASAQAPGAFKPWPPQFRISPHSLLLLAWGPESARFYDLADGRLLHSLPGATQDMAIGPRQRLVALVRGGRIELWGLSDR